MLHYHVPTTSLAGHRQAVYYPPTGTGRDTYIITDRGGTFLKYSPQGVPNSTAHMKLGAGPRMPRIRLNVKHQKYASDGTGRDNYVVSGHGGQFICEEDMAKSLRDYFSNLRSHPAPQFNESERHKFIDQRTKMAQTLHSNSLAKSKGSRLKYEELVETEKRRLRATSSMVR